MKSISKLVAAALIALAGASSAQAGLMGDQVGIRYLGQNDTGVQSVLVGAGEEGNFFGNQFFDFGDFSFSIRSIGNYCGIWTCSAVPVSLLLTDLDFGQPLTGVVFSTSLTGVNVSYGSDFVTFSWTEQSLSPETYLSARFDVGQAPEPASLALMGLGLAGLAATRRRKQTS
jgi:opacity protein-like surface antigen